MRVKSARLQRCSLPPRGRDPPRETSVRKLVKQNTYGTKTRAWDVVH